MFFCFFLLNELQRLAILKEKFTGIKENPHTNSFEEKSILRILYLKSPSKIKSITIQDMLLIRLLLEDQDHSDIAALIITGKGNVFPARIVFHDWNKLFTDLIAAVVADTLEVNEYEEIAKNLATCYILDAPLSSPPSTVLLQRFAIRQFQILQHRQPCKRTFRDLKIVTV